MVRSGDIWTASLSEHKTAGADKPRVLHFGEHAQQRMRPYLLQNPDAYVFSPRRAIKERSDASETHRRENQKPTPRKTDRTINERYNSTNLRVGIERACKRAGIEKWEPYRLRHSFATRYRSELSIEHVQAALGHSDIQISLVYAEVDRARAVEAARKLG